MKTFKCGACGSTVYFENVQCLRCGHALGFRPDKLDWAGAPQPAKSGTVLMLRGLGDEAPHFPAMLSPMADF